MPAFYVSCVRCDVRGEASRHEPATFEVLVMDGLVAIICARCGLPQSFAAPTPRGSRWGDMLARAEVPV
jgi:hypothetical protein